MKTPQTSGLLFGLLPLCFITSAEAAPPAKQVVSVSSANYERSTRDELNLAEVGKSVINPSPRPVESLPVPERYVFVPGVIYETDIPYEEICQRLATALRRKGFINATDSQGRVVDPNNVDLILRVYAGERLWRKPLIRTESITWKDGIMPRPRGRSLVTLGGDVVLDYRAGGNDEVLDAMNENASSPAMGFGSSPGSPAGLAPAGGLAGASYDFTREFFLLVVDAYRYQDLLEKGQRAKRIWTTFVAAPREREQEFSDVFNTLLRVGTPYFGETTRGLQLFNDARANVTPGEIEVIETDVKNPHGRL